MINKLYKDLLKTELNNWLEPIKPINVIINYIENENDFCKISKINNYEYELNLFKERPKEGFYSLVSPKYSIKYSLRKILIEVTIYELINCYKLIQEKDIAYIEDYLYNILRLGFDKVINNLVLKIKKENELNEIYPDKLWDIQLDTSKYELQLLNKIKRLQDIEYRFELLNNTPENQLNLLPEIQLKWIGIS